YLRGQLVGLIDMRDKAGKQAFDGTDVPKALRIADRIAELFTNKNVFNLRYITLSEMEGAEGRTRSADDVPATAPPPSPTPAQPPLATPQPTPRPLPPAPSRKDSGTFKPRLASLI